MGNRLETCELLIAEYNSLREEINKRIELEYQLIYLSLSTFGVIIGIGLQNHSSLLITLYPILSIFINLTWVNSDISVKLIASYIKNRIELKFGEDNIGWEHYIGSRRSFILSSLSVSSTFIGTSLIAILVGLYLAKFDAIEIMLFIISGMSLICSIILQVWYFFYRRQSITDSRKIWVVSR